MSCRISGDKNNVLPAWSCCMLWCNKGTCGSTALWVIVTNRGGYAPKPWVSCGKCQATHPPLPPLPPPLYISAVSQTFRRFAWFQCNFLPESIKLAAKEVLNWMSDMFNVPFACLRGLFISLFSSSSNQGVRCPSAGSWFDFLIFLPATNVDDFKKK